MLLKMFYYVNFPELQPWFLRGSEAAVESSSSSLPATTIPSSSSPASSSSSTTTFCDIPLSFLVPLRKTQPDQLVRLSLGALNDLQRPYWRVQQAECKLDKRTFAPWLKQ